MKHLITICIRRYYNLRILKNITKCCSSYCKMRRLDLLQKAAPYYKIPQSLLQNVLCITKCVVITKRHRTVTRKYIFISFVLLRNYFKSLKFCGKNGELSRNQIGRSGVQVKKENEKFTVARSRSPQNLKWGHFTLLFCRGRQRNVAKCKTHVQSDVFAH